MNMPRLNDSMRLIVGLIISFIVAGAFLINVLTPPTWFNFIPFGIHQSLAGRIPVSELVFIVIFDFAIAILLFVFVFKFIRILLN
jgi:hypothetical protein